VTGPVTVVVARAVTGGQEAELHTWAQKLTDAAEEFPGFLGWGLLRPAPGGDVWHVVYRFDAPDHLEGWQRSEVPLAGDCRRSPARWRSSFRSSRS
jgi:antibiotic biosynthesis monooxygenase (ABM) superfamily enzyme